MSNFVKLLAPLLTIMFPLMLTVSFVLGIGYVASADFGMAFSLFGLTFVLGYLSILHILIRHEQHEEESS